MTRPILWSFRRCPYAMRARLAVQSAGITVELREILLRDKPAEFLQASPKGTVPVLQADGRVIEESLDLMLWALNQNDPEDWLAMPGHGYDLIEEADGPFKSALDRYKYTSRHVDVDIGAEQHKAGLFLHQLDRSLKDRAFLFGDRPRLADMAILPFVRQFAHVDLDWFNAQPWPGVSSWLADFKSSDRFGAIMKKHPQWQPGQAPVAFPERRAA
ncbi:MAG: glutathione S-transferase [Silicimonas sp.]|nr:glutathione S-transferase [Silicimonas sp.]